MHLSLPSLSVNKPTVKHRRQHEKNEESAFEAFWGCEAQELDGPPNNPTHAASSVVGEPTGGWTHVTPLGRAQQGPGGWDPATRCSDMSLNPGLGSRMGAQLHHTGRHHSLC